MSLGAGIPGTRASWTYFTASRRTLYEWSRPRPVKEDEHEPRRPVPVRFSRRERRPRAPALQQDGDRQPGPGRRGDRHLQHHPRQRDARPRARRSAISSRRAGPCSSSRGSSRARTDAGRRRVHDRRDQDRREGLGARALSGPAAAGRHPGRGQGAPAGLRVRHRQGHGGPHAHRHHSRPREVRGQGRADPALRLVCSCRACWPDPGNSEVGASGGDGEQGRHVRGEA